VAFQTHLFDLPNAGSAIGSEDQAKQSGDQIVVLPALPWGLELFAVGTGGVMVLQTTGSYLAPFGFYILVAPWAPLFQIGTASPTIQATIGNKSWIVLDTAHG